MKALSPLDQIFLWLERRQQPMHVAGLQLFEFPEGAGEHYVSELAQWLRQFKKPAAPFNQRLTRRFGQPFWTEDKQFDLEHHFRHEALPAPGRIRELLTLVSSEHSNLMDRERPMWEYHLIEGFQDRRFAVYCKIHHSMMDGISAMRTGTRALTTNPDEYDLPPVWARHHHKTLSSASLPLPNPLDIASSVAKLTAGLNKQLSTIPTVAREIYKAGERAKTDPDFISVFQAPHTILNDSITGSRRFAAQSFSVARIARIAKAFHATLNDVVLAICGSALRNYLIMLRKLPDKPLIAMVPVSLRKDESAEGNQVAMILANLGTHIADPSDRLQMVKASVRNAKKRFAGMTPEEITNYTALTLAPTGLNLMTGLRPDWLAFNVVISNVPGPRDTLYWNGARLLGMYPVSIALNHVALNITLTSYCDQLEFGLIACRRTMPSMQRMLTYIENGLNELEIAADLHSCTAEESEERLIHI
ncbi:Uncharacterised protein family (UPF0089) [gamma proteobacterium HdN1]|nr:Uncharacterised protein family (UPF0089) [gamma proteobacterium HdN1]